MKMDEKYFGSKLIDLNCSWSWNGKLFVLKQIAADARAEQAGDDRAKVEDLQKHGRYDFHIDEVLAALDKVAELEKAKRAGLKIKKKI